MKKQTRASAPEFERLIKKLANPKVDRVTIVALGDSNTELTWHTRGGLNWVGLLQEALFETYGRNRIYVINAGACGDSAQGALGRLDRDVLRFQPDLVIIAFGMNDAGRGVEGIPAYKKAMTALIRRCRAAGAAVLLRTSNPVLWSPLQAGGMGLKPGDEVPGRPVREYAAAAVAVAHEQRCAFVDHYSLWMKSTFQEYPQPPNTRWLRMSDEVHPGWQGHLAFYRELAPLFKVPVHFPWEDA